MALAGSRAESGKGSWEYSSAAWTQHDVDGHCKISKWDDDIHRASTTDFSASCGCGRDWNDASSAEWSWSMSPARDEAAAQKLAKPFKTVSIIMTKE